MEVKPIVIDSKIEMGAAIQQNPSMPAPQEVLDELSLLTVTYFGFDQKIHQGQIVVHKKVAQDVALFFEEALRLQFPIEKVIPIATPKYAWDDNVSCDDNNSSGYNFRYIGGTTKMSKHARGLAFDINPVQNPYIKYDENVNELWRAPKDSSYDERAPGTLYVGHPLVTLLKEKGWEWGGDWAKEGGRIDYQHFEFDL